MCSSKRNAWVNGKGRCLSFGVPVVWRVPRNHSTDLFLYGAPYSKWYVHKEKINTCVSEYTISKWPVPHGDGLSVPEPPDNFAIYSDDYDSVSSNSEEQQPSVQEMQTTCQAQAPPIIRSQKASSLTSSGISNFQKIRQKFWHQSYNIGIYYTTPWCSKFNFFSWKFKSCKFHRTCTRSYGFV